MAIQILTDSSCDLTLEQFSELDIQIAPLTVHLDGQDYEDGVTIQAKTVYDAMRQGKAPKTSQISPQTFKEIFTSHAKENKPLVYIAFSSQLSGTYQTAK